MDTETVSPKYPKGMNYTQLLTWILAIVFLVAPAHATFLDISSGTNIAIVSLDKPLPSGFIDANNGAYVFDDKLVSIIGGGWSPSSDLIYLAPTTTPAFSASVETGGLAVLPPYSFYNLTDGTQSRLIPPATFLINRTNNAVWAITFNPIFDNRWDVWGTVYYGPSLFTPGDTTSMDIPTGDANLDGVVDASDLSIVLNNFGGSDLWSDSVNLSDVSDILNNFGANYFPSTPSISSAPEPATLLILPLAFLARKRK